MTASLIVSILLVVLYVGATIWKRRGLPESISAMVFDLPKGWQWVWGVWLWAVAFLTSIPAIEVLDKKGFGGIAFCMLVALVFTGAIPLYDKNAQRAHYIFAISAGIISQICVLIVNPWWLLLWLLIIIIPFVDRMWWHPSVPVWMWKKGTFVAEGICYITLTGALLHAINHLMIN